MLTISQPDSLTVPQTNRPVLIHCWPRLASSAHPTHLAAHASLYLCWCAALMPASPTAMSSNAAAATPKHRACSASRASSSGSVNCRQAWPTQPPVSVQHVNQQPSTLNVLMCWQEYVRTAHFHVRAQRSDIQTCSVHEVSWYGCRHVSCCCHQPLSPRSQQMYVDDTPLTSLNAAAYAASAASAARLHSASATPWHITGQRSVRHIFYHHVIRGSFLPCRIHLQFLLSDQRCCCCRLSVRPCATANTGSISSTPLAEPRAEDKVVQACRVRVQVTTQQNRRA